MKRIIFCMSLIIISLDLFALNEKPILYTYSIDKLEKVFIDDKGYSPEKIRKNIEKKFSVTLEQSEQIVSDTHNNSICINYVNIVTTKEIQDLYDGPGHTSNLIIELALNMIQPELSRYYVSWPIDILIISINGKFLHTIDYDRSYPSIFTVEMLQSVVRGNTTE